MIVYFDSNRIQKPAILRYASGTKRAASAVRNIQQVVNAQNDANTCSSQADSNKTSFINRQIFNRRWLNGCGLDVRSDGLGFASSHLRSASIGSSQLAAVRSRKNGMHFRCINKESKKINNKKDKSQAMVLACQTMNWCSAQRLQGRSNEKGALGRWYSE